eukprot:CAMPEP_0115839244 /NCGR_PEP_ID=MMETSP0287-20121206/6153_1 /TAXON_ID=412157 /ORGANISM="Chrysochromulina rotalis, Strain UIO044" /LENGTH=31 /DNA_ID= /DNA_START= /DNA_END= /DNA_ORIENTATION=
MDVCASSVSMDCVYTLHVLSVKSGSRYLLAR